MSTAVQISPGTQPPAPALVSSENAEFRRRVGSISHHSIVSFSGTLFTAIAGYFFKVYLARALGAEALGLYALGISIVSVISLFNSVGLPTAGNRFVAEYSTQGDHQRLGAFLRGGISFLGFGNIVLGAVLLLVMPVIATRFYRAPALAAYSWSFAAIMLMGVLNAFLGQCMAGFRAVARRTLITHFAGTSTTILLAVALIALHFGLRGYLLAQVASAAVVLGCMAYSLWKLTPPVARTTGGLGHIERRVMAFSVTTFGIAIVHFVLAQADKITLGHYLDVKQVGIYAVTVGVAGFVPVALSSVNQIFAPMIAELHSGGNRELLQRLYRSLTKWVLAFTFPLAAALIVFAAPVMTVFGPEFRNGAPVLVVGVIAQLVNCGVGSVGLLLLMSGNQVALMKIQSGSAVLMVVLNLLLVPRMGILGAAVGSSASVVMTNLWGLMEVRKRLGLSACNRSYLKVIISGMVTVSALAIQRGVFPHASWRAAGLGLVMAYAVFFATLFLLGPDAEDRMLARMARNKFFGDSNGDFNEQYA